MLKFTKFIVIEIAKSVVAAEARSTLLATAKVGAVLKVVGRATEAFGQFCLDSAANTAERLTESELDHRLFEVVEKVRATKVKSEKQDEFYRDQILPILEKSHRDGAEIMEAHPELARAQVAYYNEGSLKVWTLMFKILKSQIDQAQAAAEAANQKREIISHTVRIVDASELGALQEKLKKHLEQNGVRFAPQPPRD